MAEGARVKKFNSHQCRHTTATEELAAGIPVMAIAEHLGHSDLRQMTTYAKVSAVHRQAGLDAMEELVKAHRPPKAPPGLWPAPPPALEPVKPAPRIRVAADKDEWADISGAL